MMAIVAVTVFVVAYLLIATERVSKTITALAGAGVILALGVATSEDAFYSAETGIDWDVIFLLLGMMIIVGVLRRTGVFEFVAIWAAKRAKGSPLRVMILLVLITAVASALLDNVTTVLLIGRQRELEGYAEIGVPGSLVGGRIRPTLKDARCRLL